MRGPATMRPCSGREGAGQSEVARRSGRAPGYWRFVLRGRRSGGRGDGRRRLAGSWSHADRPAGPTGRTARGDGPWSTVRVTRVDHGLVMPVMVVEVMRPGVPAEYEAAKEHDRGDEHDPGDDGDPGCGLVEPVRLLRFCCRGGSPPGGGFRCFSHVSNNAWVNNSRRYVLVM